MGRLPQGPCLPTAQCRKRTKVLPDSNSFASGHDDTAAVMAAAMAR
jgi:hypothetical protein